LKAVREFHGYIEANQNFIPNYGDRYRHGEKISTAFAESAVNQVVSKRMVKKQQMRWSESGAHNLLQVRTKVLNDELRETFVRWYPGMQAKRRDDNREEGCVAPGLKCSPVLGVWGATEQKTGLRNDRYSSSGVSGLRRGRNWPCATESGSANAYRPRKLM